MATLKAYTYSYNDIIFAFTYVDDNSKLFLCDYSIACTDLIAFVLRDSIYSSLLYIRK